MDDLDKLAGFIEKQHAIIRAEQQVVRELLAALIASHAKEHENPEEYIMTMTSPIVAGFDATKAEGEMANIGYDHAV